MNASPPAYYSPVLTTYLRNLTETSLKFQRDLMHLEHTYLVTCRERYDAFMAAPTARLDLYKEEDERLKKEQKEAVDTLMRTYDHDKHLLYVEYYAQVVEDRKARKQAKKYRKVDSVAMKQIRGGRYDRNRQSNQLRLELMIRLRNIDIERYLIVALRCMPEALIAHFERHRRDYEPQDDCA